MKPILEWINEIPEKEVRLASLMYFQQWWKTDMAYSIYEAIKSAFIWENSQEGYTWWKEKALKYK